MHEDLRSDRSWIVNDHNNRFRIDRGLLWSVFVHLLLDLATLGIWELPGSIYELRSEHRKGDVGFVYGPDDHVLEIQDYQAIQAQAVGDTDPQSLNEQWGSFWNAMNK